jgi:hypothetical protein
MTTNCNQKLFHQILIKNCPFLRINFSHQIKSMYIENLVLNCNTNILIDHSNEHDLRKVDLFQMNNLFKIVHRKKKIKI